ncbi:MAG: hypothetical protein DWQ44_13905 [Bacteroidetes bacterium]|nr:MAG: hypothetical protein DWQ33_03265 [Bacteroidota bacterium]REK07241.1 MAG: hypothetical protein DWQ39_01780 [Bacteroidota bacterium]REK31772.1 MAG: hypothetical protein DWQ44_13905 [Bacteroidota bacterium]REK48048.1 MAG: hypothetical protein DWQ48_11235 [Bacteroidota bacterium]
MKGSYRYTDVPEWKDESLYDVQREKMLDFLTKLPDVLSVYQVGSVGIPGISDLDLVVIFRNGCKSLKQPLDILDDEGRYVFIHNLYACSESYFREAVRYSIFSPYYCLWGRHILDEETLSSPVAEEIGFQIALEFLVQMFVNAAHTREFRLIKVRSLLLHAKGVKFDLKILGDEQCNLGIVTNKLIAHRENWFSNTSQKKDTAALFEEFYSALKQYLELKLLICPMYLPGKSAYNISKRVKLVKSDKLAYSRKGIVFPSVLSSRSDYMKKVQNRLNSFEVYCPFRSDGYGNVLKEYFDFHEKYRKYNRIHLPHYYTLSSSLKA